MLRRGMPPFEHLITDIAAAEASVAPSESFIVDARVYGTERDGSRLAHVSYRCVAKAAA